MGRFLWFLLALCMIASRASAGPSAEYVDVANPRNAISIYTQPARFGINDVLFGAVTCEAQENVICFKSRGFQFAVARDIEHQKQWMHEKTGYRVTKVLDVPILGRPGPYWLITQAGKQRLWFVYSKTRGLVMLGGLGKSARSIFVLSQSCGFGAVQDCEE